MRAELDCRIKNKLISFFQFLKKSKHLYLFDDSLIVIISNLQNLNSATLIFLDDMINLQKITFVQHNSLI